MKIFIIGLGLMGASYAEGLSKHNEVYGYDIDKEITNKAENDMIIKGHSLDEITTSDVVIFAIYPKDILSFLKNNLHLFNKTQLITDMASTKTFVIDSLSELLNGYHYLSHHPMAGREYKGYAMHSKNIFIDANFLIVYKNSYDDNDVNKLVKIASDLRCKVPILVEYHEHDRLVAHVSTLPHIIATSLVLSKDDETLRNYCGDSYRDMVRTANINEELWTELIISNGENVVQEIENFVKKLNEMKIAIKEYNKDSIEDYLRGGKERVRRNHKIK